MSQDAGTDRTVSIEADGVSVQKGFEPDAFAVPTIKIRITSEREQPVDFRLVDRIPDDFPMDGVGFHPDFGSERWTAYKNNRVVFETTLEAGETVETVYGIRISTAEQATGFLEEPSITVTPATDSESSEQHESETEPDEDLGDSLDETSVSDLVAEETSGLVREFIRGDRDILPGIGLRSDDETGADRPDAEVEPAPAADASPSVNESVDDGIDGVDIGEDDIGSHGDESTELSEGSAESDASVGIEELDEDVLPTFDHDEERSTTAETVDVDTADTADSTEKESPTKSTTEKSHMDQQIESTGSGTATHVETADRSGVAAQLAAEIESGQVSEDDLSIILSAVEREASTTRSVHTQIDHLQSRVSELDAYTEAFAAFLDEEGTGQRIVDDMQREIDSVQGDLDDVRTELGTTDDRLNGTTNRLDDTVSDLSHVEEQVTTVSERVDSIADRHDSAIDRIEERLDGLEHALDSETGELESALHGVRDDLTAVEEGLDELVSWRDQLGEMFSGR